MTSSASALLTPEVSPADQHITRSWMGLSPSTMAVIGIMLLAALLNFVNIEAIGEANTYYTAAVEAMLQSPSNFFFIAAEPGGSVTIDKPPLGLWLQAISALFLGVNGFAVVLPQILAGIFSIPLLYVLVKRYAGIGAGLIAALVMAIMPVSIAVQRNNTMDATLIFTLLLAAWAFIRATESGKLRWILLGGVLVGLGFNIKMLQAFLPLPAFYGLYFFGAKIGWRKKIAHLAVGTVVLVAVSLAWLVAVDLTPAENRPYMGSSETNSALELAIGYNGVQRLLGGQGTPGGQGFTPSTGANGQAITPPAGFTPPSGGLPGMGGGMFGGEIGSAGVLRLFSQPLDNEIGWLLPFGLLSIGILAVAVRPRLPLADEHKALILWGGWLLTEVVFFSVASFFHAYYLAMLTPPLAALVGIGLMRLWKLYPTHKAAAVGLLVAASGATVAYQLNVAAGYAESMEWAVIPIGLVLAGSAVLLGSLILPRLTRLAVVGFTCIALAVTVTPLLWSGAGTLADESSAMLPSAFGSTSMDMGGMPPLMAAAQSLSGRPDGGFPGFGGGVDETLLAYLQENTQGIRWMMAVGSSMQGADYVIESGRGVLYMGGFNGQDPVVDAQSLQAYVDAGELRYVLSSGGGMMAGPMQIDSTITDWLAKSCTVVTDVTTSSGTLYDCAS